MKTNPKSNSKSTETLNIEGLVKKLLAQHIGVEPDDIDYADSFMEDLHMSATDLADFMETLKREGIETSSLNLSNLETVNDLIESITSEELIE